MYDFMSLDISHLKRPSLERIEGMELIQSGNDKYGHPFVKYQWYNFRVYYSNLSRTLSGSIHHLFNILEGNGPHNSNDLDFYSFLDTLGKLMAPFDLGKSTHIRMIEYGVNLSTSFDPKAMMQTNLVGWDKLVGSSKNYNSRGLQCHFRAATDRLLKIYDKGKHQREHTNGKNVLRLELRYESNRAIQRAIRRKRGYEVTLEDIMSLAAARALNARILEAVGQLMIVDTIRPEMTSGDLRRFKDFLSELHWSGLLEAKRYDKRTRDFRRFQNLVSKYGIDKTKSEIIQGVQSKLIDLHNCKESHSRQKQETARNPTIDKTGISCTSTLKPIKCIHYPESHHDYPTNKRERNDESNPRNNLRKRIRKIEGESALFPVSDQIQLTEEQRRILEHWRGTDYDVLGKIGM